MTKSAPAGAATMAGPRPADDLPAVTTIAGHIMDRFIRTSPLQTTLPLTMLRRDVVTMASACLKVTADLLNGADHRKPLADVRACAMDWAHTGVSVEAVQHAVHEGLILVFDHLATRTRPAGEFLPVADVARMFVQIANQIALAISQAYLDEMRGGRRKSIDALASAVMAGTATAAMAREYGVQLAGNYLVFSVEIGPQIDESDARLDRQIIAHRKLRRVRAEITRWCGDSALMSLADRGATLLIPESRLDITDAERFVDAISTAAQAPVRATFLPATIDAVPETIERVRATLQLIRRMRRVGLHHFGDLHLEYQLTRPGAARDQLAAVLAPLDEQPVLLQTLLTHLETEATRLSTAKALHVHPNTVDYRLERIAEATGLDPRNPEGLWRLRSAAIARLAGDTDENPEHTTEVAAQVY